MGGFDCCCGTATDGTERVEDGRQGGWGVPSVFSLVAKFGVEKPKNCK